MFSYCWKTLIDFLTKEISKPKMPLVDEGGAEDFDELMEEIKKQLPHLSRPCWIPEYINKKRCCLKNTKVKQTHKEEVELDEKGDPRLVSKFGGVEPWLDPNVGWPKCAKCTNVKTFICQLLIKDLPQNLKDMLGKADGMLQCFACLKCMAFGNKGYYDDIILVDEICLRSPDTLKLIAASFVIKHESSLKEHMEEIPKCLKEYVHNLDPGGVNDPDGNTSDDDDDVDGPKSTNTKKYKLSCKEKNPRIKVKQFPERIITDWIWKWDELPHPYEIPYPQVEETVDINTDFEENYMYEWDRIYDQEYCCMTVKIGGCFPWLEDRNAANLGVNYPTCKDCKVVMNQPFMMFKECDILKYKWGDGGFAFVSACPNCKRPEFNWDSF